MFTHYLFVDWSSASVPTGKRPRRDAIWVGYGRQDEPEVETYYYPTRQAAYAFILNFLGERVRQRQRTLFGMDIGYGYPAGFAALLGFSGPTAWRQLWAFLHQNIADDARNRNNRYAVAAALNQRLSDGLDAPFWGHPPGRTYDHLQPTRRHFSFPLQLDSVTLPEYRIVDRRVAGLQSAWKLHYPASVGSQILMGIPYLYRLRFLEPELRDYSLVWPQETGFTTAPLPANKYILHAEIWPGILQIPPQPKGVIRDELQVRGMVEWARRLADSERLAEQFVVPTSLLSDSDLATVRYDEGWVLGVH